MAVTSSIVSSRLSVALYNADGSFRSPVFLVRIDLSAYGGNPARTLYLSTPGYVGPDGQLWDDAVVEVGQLNAGGTWLTSKWNPADIDLQLIDKRVTGQAVDETLHDMFRAYEFVGAPVRVMIAFSNTVDVSDYRTIFYGRIEEWREMNATSITVYCAQDRLWSKSLPPNKVDKTTYPYAPNDVMGTPRPILVGDWYTGVNEIPGAGAAYQTWLAGVTRGAFPTLPVELESAAGGATAPKVMLSDKGMGTKPDGLLYYESQLGGYAHSYTTLTTSGTGPVYGQLADYQFRGVVLPIEVDATTTATNAQELLRRDKPYTLEGRATLDFDAGKKVIRLLLPDVSPLGTFVDAFAHIWFNKPLTSGSHPQWGAENSTTADNLVAFSGGATTPSSSDVPHSSATLHLGPAALGGSDTITAWEHIAITSLLAEVRNASETLDVHRLVVSVIYKPQARVIQPGVSRTTSYGPSYSVSGRKINSPSGDPVYEKRRTRTTTSPDVTAFDTALYGYGTGVLDTGHASGAPAGYYTGTAGALIEHPCDVAHWVLRELAGVPSSEISSAVGEFGSFVDARSDLPSYKVRLQISEEQSVEEFLEDLGNQVLCWFFRRTTSDTSKWVAIPWARSESQNYRGGSDMVNFSREGAFVVNGTLRVDRSPASGVANVVRVNYDWDPRTKGYGDQVFVDDSGSRGYGGGAFSRDQNSTTPNDREALSATSVALYGRKEKTVSLTMVRDPATATSIRNRHFDWLSSPRAMVRFNTFLNALDLERGHVLRLGSDWDTYLPFPRTGGDGSWAGKNLQVLSVVKLRALPVQYAVTTVET